MKNAGKARSYGLYRHLRTSKEIIENLLNYCPKVHDAFSQISFRNTGCGKECRATSQREKTDYNIG